MTVDTAAEPITRDRLEHSVEGRPFPARGNFPSMRNCPPMIVARAAIHAVRDHPYAAIGIAVGAVFLIGMLAPPR